MRTPIAVDPDWHAVGRPEDLERSLSGFRFLGPGLYLMHGATLLVVPAFDTPHPWARIADATYGVHVWNAPYAETVMRWAAGVPFRRVQLHGAVYDIDRDDEGRWVLTTGNNVYCVDLAQKTCSCPDCTFRGNECKHIRDLTAILGAA